MQMFKMCMRSVFSFKVIVGTVKKCLTHVQGDLIRRLVILLEPFRIIPFI